MLSLDDIIKSENESTYVDFKRISYSSKKWEDLIKDIMSMANAQIDGDRYIIIGVGFDEKERHFFGVIPLKVPDSATYQQIIRENIEPDIEFDVSLYPLDGKNFEIFRIGPCDNKPYVMKKDHNSLRKGDMWKRVGDHQTRMLRADLEKIYTERYQQLRYNGEIQITFYETDSPEVDIPSIADWLKPSDCEIWKMKKALDRKLNSPPKTTMADFISSSPLANYSLNPFSYDNRSIDELEEMIKTAHSHFKENDEFVLFEELSHKVNLTINNLGNRYLEDVRLTLEIPTKGVQVATKVHSEPISYGNLVAPIRNNGASKTYPNVKLHNSSIKIMAEVGDVPHQIPTTAFKIPIRLALFPEIIGSTIEVTCTIHARNLETPFVQSLKIHVVAPRESV